MKRTCVLTRMVLGLVLFILPVPGVAAGMPARPAGYVNDYAGLLSPADESRISALAGQLENKTSAQLAVVTVRSTAPQTIESYAVELFEKWGIGQRGKDNGVLLLMAAQDRKVRIEVGYGLEGVLTDAMSSNIIQQFLVPAFRAGKYSEGLYQGSLAIASLVAEDAGVSINPDQQAIASRARQKPSALASFINFIFTLLFFILIVGSRSPLLWLLLFPGGHRRGGYWYGSGLGGGSRGGFSGGFGGFGGGLSGGGGASGGW